MHRNSRYLLFFLLSFVAISVAVGILLKIEPSPTAAQQPSRPNVIIIMTDDQDVDSLPVMRKLMSFPGGAWVNFKNAFTNDSICCPSRATVLTGQYSHTHQVIKNGLGLQLDDNNTLATWLDSAGYQTGLFGKYQNGFPWNLGKRYQPPGWDEFVGKGGLIDTLLPRALTFLNTSQAPFFLYLSPVDPHFDAKPPGRYKNTTVYIPPYSPNFNEADVSDKPAWIKNLPLLSKSKVTKWRNERINSQRALLAVDDAIQAIVDNLSASGQLDNTMIIFMSDHGFSWGSHRWEKKHCPYDECNRFPLLIRFPGQAGNREEHRFVSNADLAATIAEFTGINPGRTQDGRSLMPLLQNTATYWDDAVLLEKHEDALVEVGYYGVRTPQWLYIEYNNPTHEKELYDILNDPYQMENVANKPAYQVEQTKMATKLQELLAGIRPTPTPSPTVIPSPSPEPSPTPEPTVEPTSQPTASPSAYLDPSPTPFE